MAGVRHEDTDSIPADFDVEAAFDPDFDFDALFAADDLDEAADVKASVPRHRVAIAVAVTLAALPLLFLDNFQANASTPARVDASAGQLHLAPTGPPLGDSGATPYVSIAAPTSATPVTVAAAVVFNAAAPTVTSVAAPATTTTKAPALTTTTTAKPKLAAASASVITATTVKPAPTTTTTKPPAPSTTVAAAVQSTRLGDPNAEASWDALARCESGGNWAANTGNGYYGGLQFSLATWQNLGGQGTPNQASKATQIEMGKKLYRSSGWNAWPGCASSLGWT